MRKFFKITGYIIGSIIVLLLGVVVWLNTNSGKRFVKDKAVSFLRKKLKTEVYVGNLGYALPKMIVLEDVLIKDQQKDTLLAVRKLKVDISMLKLINSNVDIQELRLEGVHANIYRNAPDTNFNFSYIVQAFASDKKKEEEPEKPEDTTATLTIHADRVMFNDIHLKFDDYTGGSRFAMDLEHLDLRVKDIDLDEMKYDVKSLTVRGLNTVFIQDTSYLPEKPEDTTASKPFHISADELNLERVAFKFEDVLGKFLFDINVGKLLVHPRKIDLPTQFIDIKDFALNDTRVRIRIGTVAAKDSIAADTTASPLKWRVFANSLALNRVFFAMDDDTKPRQPYGMDYSHLDLQNLMLDAADVVYTTDTIAANLKNLSVKEKSGFDLKVLRTNFVYQPQGAILRDLYLQTSNTLLQNYVEVRYPSLEALSTNMEALQLKLNLQKSLVGFKDILIFAPDLRKQDIFRKYPNGQMKLEAIVAGYMNALNISRFYLAGLGNTLVDLNGKLNGLPDANKLNYNLNITKLQSTRADMEAVLPREALSSIRLPNVFAATGQVAGTTQDYRTNLVITSTDGSATLRGTIAMSPGKGRERYDLNIGTRQLNLGRILKQDTLLGKVTANFIVKGQSFDVNKMNATVKGNIISAGVKGYNYQSITLDGKMARKKGEFNLVSNDPNARLNLVATADLNNKYPAMTAVLHIDSIDMQALKLYQEELRVRGTLYANAPVLNPDYPEATLLFDQPTVVTGGQRLFMDTLSIISAPTPDSGQNIVIDADVLHAAITGRLPLTQTGAVIQEHLNRHLMLPPDSTQTASNKGKKTPPKTEEPLLPTDYNLNLTAHIEDRPLLRGLLPELKELDTVRIDAGIDPRNMFLNLSAPKVVYGANTIQNTQVKVNGTDSALTYSATVDKFAQGNILLWYTSVSGNMDGKNISADISIADSARTPRFALSALYQQGEQEQVIQLRRGLMLNYNTWQVQEPNKIVLAPAGFYVSNFGINNAGQSITINSQQPVPNAPLAVNINNFLLSNITEIISQDKDSLVADGVLNGTVNVQQIKPTPLIDANLKVTNFAALGDTVGDIAIVANTPNDNTVDANVTITGQGNNVSLAGQYFMKPVNGNSFDMRLLINPLNLKSIEGLTAGAIRNSSGSLKGDIKIQGTTTAPRITGELRTEQLRTNVSMLNSYFTMPSESITFTQQGVGLNSFKILDSAGNTMTINGTVNTPDYKDYRFDLTVKAKDWQAVNATPQDNELFYGKLFLSSDLQIGGTPTSPIVDGKLNIQEGTKMTVVLPESKVDVQDREGIVEFVDMSDTNRYRLLTVRDTVPRTLAFETGANINVNVEIDEEAEFSLIIDQGTGDFLRVQGKAELNTSIAPDGTVGLVGVYQLKEGEYELNYNLIKRKFKIQEGSTITFAGDPLTADIALTAIYNANVPPYDLVEKQVDQDQLVYYKQRLPFEVHMKLNGEIMKPVITFDIVLPEDKNFRAGAGVAELVQGKLSNLRNDVSELNKQVFALLILNRFVGENPFETGAGGGLEYAAKQSASRFISSQLNKFADQLVQGLELNLDLASTEDYTTGEKRDRTDLNISASKRLLDDRLTITIGNNFEIDGPRTNNSDQGSSLIPGNLAADYQLTPDGRYVVRAYRRNEDEGVIEGYVVETGVSFIVTLNYNRFKQVFNKKKRERERLERQRRREENNRLENTEGNTQGTSN